MTEEIRVGVEIIEEAMTDERSDEIMRIAHRHIMSFVTEVRTGDRIEVDAFGMLGALTFLALARIANPAMAFAMMEHTRGQVVRHLAEEGHAETKQ